MKLNLSGIVLPTKGIFSHGHRKIHIKQHNVIFNSSFLLICGVEYLAITCLSRNCPENELSLYLEDLDLAKGGQMWLKNDGAPPHFSKKVMGFLNENYEGRWNGRHGLLVWPARSPDLNPLNFCLSVCMKSRVYHCGKPEGRHQWHQIWSICWYHKQIMMQEVTTFNGTMTGNMHTV